MSIKRGNPGGIGSPTHATPGTHPSARRGSRSRACGSTAVHHAEGHRDIHVTWGRGPGKGQSPGHVPLAGHLSRSAHALQTPAPSTPRSPPGCRSSTAQLHGTSSPRHGPPESVSCCSARSVGRDGASPSPAKSPSRLERGQGERVTLAPCTRAKGVCHLRTQTPETALRTPASRVSPSPLLPGR